MKKKSQLSDEELMLAYQKGNKEVFEELLGRHQNGIYNYLYRFLDQGENVEEAFQEVFIRVIKSSLSYTPTAKFTTWVYTIARNYCIDHSRKKRFRQTISLDQEIVEEGDSYGTLGDRMKDDRPTPEEEFGALDFSRKLQIALDRINPDQREVFLLREKSGLPFDEIATVVNASVNTVKSRMRYALAALQIELKKLGILDPTED